MVRDPHRLTHRPPTTPALTGDGEFVMPEGPAMPAPTITGVNPTSAYAGQTITVTGTNLDAANVDYFAVGGRPAHVATVPARTPTTVGLIVPPGATVGGAAKVQAFQGGTAQVTDTSLTITAAPVNQPGQSQLARDWRMDVKDPATGNYVQVRGGSNLAPLVDPTLQDDTDNDNDGGASQTKTMLAWTASPKLRRKRYAGSEDRGQQILRRAALTFGDGGVVDVRMYERIAGGLAYQGFAEVTYKDDNGGTPDLKTASVELTGKGLLTEIVNPNG